MFPPLYLPTVGYPAASDVRSGVQVANATGTLNVGGGGTYSDPGVTNVKAGTSYTFNSVTETGTYDPITGNYTDPGVAHVQAGTTYKVAGSTLTGTYDPVTGNYTDPLPAHVEQGRTYKFAGATETGTLTGAGGRNITIVIREIRVNPR